MRILYHRVGNGHFAPPSCRDHHEGTLRHSGAQATPTAPRTSLGLINYTTANNHTSTNKYPIRQYSITYQHIVAKMPVAQSAEFKKAIADSRKLKAKPTNDELLQVCHPTTSIQTPDEGTDKDSSTVSSSREAKTHHSSRPPLQACSR